MNYVSGEILTEDGFKKGYVSFQDKTIIEIIYKKCPKKPVCKGLIVPTFINAHTHLGDSFIKNKKIRLPKNIKNLVAPPYGLKHILLKKASNDEIIKGMKKSIDLMSKTGTKYFCDFRENGINGISQLKSALQFSNINCFILSRPVSLSYDKKELDLLLKNSDGIGISSSSDWDIFELRKIALTTKKKKKIFAIHISERVREKIEDILELKPNFIIHMLKANKKDLEICKQKNIPIVICPRSNAFFGLKPNYKILKSIGNDLLIGTDNAMLNSPNILEEINFIKKETKLFSDENLLNMITYKPRKVLNLNCCILGPDSKAGFMVLDKKTLKPLYNSINN
jgi:cytosine/adenosine deaminase-related metal-dependent hydrolase